jgi:hypothetical protein
MVNNDASTNGTPTIEPLTGHPVAEENVTEPPVSRMVVAIMPLEEKHTNDENEDEDRYWPSPPLVLLNEDGSAIKVRDFVTKVHAYLNENKEDIIWAKEDFVDKVIDLEDGWKATGVGPESDQDSMERACYIFNGVQEDHRDPEFFSVSVEIWVDGEFGETLEEFWHTR